MDKILDIKRDANTNVKTLINTYEASDSGNKQYFETVGFKTIIENIIDIRKISNGAIVITILYEGKYIQVDLHSNDFKTKISNLLYKISQGYFVSKFLLDSLIEHIDCQVAFIQENDYEKRYYYDKENKTLYIKIDELIGVKGFSLTKTVVPSNNIQGRLISKKGEKTLDIEENPAIRIKNKKLLLPWFNETFRPEVECDSLLLIAHYCAIISGISTLPALQFIGGPGTGKTTSARISKNLLDPCNIDILQYNDIDSVLRTLSTCRVTAYDNTGDITTRDSNALAAAISRATYTKRKLFTDSEECSYQSKSALIITGINPLPTKKDLLDRFIFFKSKKIDSTNRTSEEEIESKFESIKSKILSGLVQVVLEANDKLANIKTNEKIHLQTRFPDAEYFYYSVADCIDPNNGIYNMTRSLNRQLNFKRYLFQESNSLITAVMEYLRTNNLDGILIDSFLKNILNIARKKMLDTNNLPGASNWVMRKMKEIEEDLISYGVSFDTKRLNIGNTIFFKISDKKLFDSFFSSQEKPVNNKIFHKNKMSLNSGLDSSYNENNEVITDADIEAVFADHDDIKDDDIKDEDIKDEDIKDDDIDDDDIDDDDIDDDDIEDDDIEDEDIEDDDIDDDDIDDDDIEDDDIEDDDIEDEDIEDDIEDEDDEPAITSQYIDEETERSINDYYRLHNIDRTRRKPRKIRTRNRNAVNIA